MTASEARQTLIFEDNAIAAALYGEGDRTLRILERELALQPDNDERARRRLAEVLGPDAGDRSLDDLNRELATRLRSGSDSELEQRAWPALLEIVRGKLAVNKPGHDSYDFAPEISSEIDR